MHAHMPAHTIYMYVIYVYMHIIMYKYICYILYIVYTCSIIYYYILYWDLGLKECSTFYLGGLGGVRHVFKPSTQEANGSVTREEENNEQPRERQFILENN